ncbi:DUF2929 family protein [Pseudogracilibacillus sp. SO30301A]|uniref:DUF2929 family protein n=1 Tax=Pseudogracilibacillus sp. SO30301A TaxID=3098291 RepID=UPI00300E6B9D
MRFIMTIIWALLIGGALAYVLSSMGGETFNITQSIMYSAGVFIAILLIDGVLTTQEQE